MPANPEPIFEGPEGVAATIVLSHGAGAGMDTPFMNAFAEGVCEPRISGCGTQFLGTEQRSGKIKGPCCDTEFRPFALEVRNHDEERR